MWDWHQDSESGAVTVIHRDRQTDRESGRLDSVNECLQPTALGCNNRFGSKLPFSSVASEKAVLRGNKQAVKGEV